MLHAMNLGVRQACALIGSLLLGVGLVQYSESDAFLLVSSLGIGLMVLALIRE